MKKIRENRDFCLFWHVAHTEHELIHVGVNFYVSQLTHKFIHAWLKSRNMS